MAMVLEALEWLGIAELARVAEIVAAVDWSVLLFRSMLGSWRVLLGRRVWRPGLLRKLGLSHWAPS
jgi:hypothetical protein